MAEADAPWLAAVPPHLRPALARAAAGLPANVALMQLLAECRDGAEAEAALQAGSAALGDRPEADRLRAVYALLQANPEAGALIRQVLGGLDHAHPAGGVDYWAAAFDRAAAASPEATVALYSLGDAALLEAATREIVGFLHAAGLLTKQTACLDIGCGIGRFECALAGRVGRIVGIDIAPAMLAEARRRTAGLGNVEILQASGRDLAGFPDATFDIVLAVDAFPYIVQAGLAGHMAAEAARVLRPGGSLVILNYSYRGDPAQDREELAALAAASGLTVREVSAEFSFWDGIPFRLDKAEAQLSM